MSKGGEKNLLTTVTEMGARARHAAAELLSCETAKKNHALLRAAELIDQKSADILDVNARETDAAQKKNLDDAFIDRMRLDADRLADICRGLKQIAGLPDPVGKIMREWSRPNGLRFQRVAVPIGVMAVIYESRPNVTIDAAALAVKAGNAALLRGGSECLRTATALYSCFRDACVEAGLPGAAAQIVDTTDRAAVGALLGGLDNRIDLVIPRGGKSLVARIQQEARVPVLSHLDGICHVYLDRDADTDKAVSIAHNSKMRRPGVCGAAETLLVDSAALSVLLQPVAAALTKAGCELRGDEAVRQIESRIIPATEQDWHTEYLAPIISIAAVDGVAGAIDHIRRYSSGHTESIVTENEATAEAFLKQVDSAIVLHNASTQFADGGEFGLGGEIGIATGRLHARGPVGLEELTTYKNVVRGNGQIRP